MMNLTRLEDSPMFRKQVQAGEDGAEILRDRCQKFYKGCRKYTEGLGEAYDSDISFASTIEMFGGGHDDPISIAVGGPVMSKFTIALREIGTYKEVLRSQVEHMLNDRLMQFVNMDLQDVKEFRKRFDKASLHYDQVREKYMSLKKNTSISVVTEIEEDLHNARLAFEQARFNLVSALSNIESRKKYEFLEAVSGTMDAHLRYFKQGYELFCQMEPYIHQVLTYAQQCRERTNNEQAILLERMEEYKRQIEVESLQSSKESESASGDGIQVVGRSSHRLIESIMQATSKGKVQAIKQGYLLKRSSNLRGDWKRRFFVLDSRGMLYYYRKQGNKPAASGNHQLSQRPSYSSDHVTGLFGRLLSSRHLTQQEENTVLHHTVNLLTSTIKVDAEQTDLRFCFRIISPSKVYTLQAESAIERTDWINKITAVIASLLSAQSSEQVGYSQRTPQSPAGSSRQGSFSETQSASSSSDIDHLSMDESTFAKGNFYHHPDSSTKAQGHSISAHEERPLDIMRKVPGNNECADCGCDEPDWASLNLGILLCIECSGVHRNLGVHISKVRSLTLDVKVWEPSVIHLFKSLGNTYANSVWEEHLGAEYNSSNVDERINEMEDGKSPIGMKKPHPKDSLSIKEKFIFSKYVEKRYVLKDCIDEFLSPESLLWDAVQQNNTQLAYSIIVKHNANIATIYEQAKLDSASSPSHDTTEDHFENSQASTSGASSPDSLNSIQNGMHGCTLLHLACYSGGMAMIELLLQYGADINARDKRGKTPLHHCISKGNNMTAKFLLRRGASTVIADNGGKTPLQRAMEFGAITDDELFLLLSEGDKFIIK